MVRSRSGKGGNMIDFGILYHHCSIPELLQKLSPTFSFHQKTPTVQQPWLKTQSLQEALEPKIKSDSRSSLTSPTLCRYLNDRKVPVDISKKYCKEVDFEINNKSYVAIGFENRSGGFELRNRFFKGSSSPKDVTFLENNRAKEVAVFEGFFSFLSYQTLHQKDLPLTNFLVLNSLAFIEKNRQLMEGHQKIYMYLDRDQAGVKNTECALQWDEKYINKSDLYKNHKDLNDYLKIGIQRLTKV